MSDPPSSEQRRLGRGDDEPPAGRSPDERGPGSGGNMRLAGLGVELAAAVVGGSLLGYWIDRRFGTAPLWLLICAGIGVIGGLYNLIRQALKETGSVNRNAARDQSRRTSGDGGAGL